MNDDSEHPIFDRLRKLAEAENTDSETAKDIEYAAWALHFIAFNSDTEKFKKFIDQAEAPLTDDQIAHLKSMGPLR